MRGLFVVVAMSLWAATATQADEVHLTTGRSIIGEVVKESDREVVVKTAGGKVTLPRRIVERIERNEKRLKEPPPRPAGIRPGRGTENETNSGGPESELHTYRWAWPVPAKLSVREIVDEDEFKATLHHRLTLKPAQGGELRLRFERTRFLKGTARAARVANPDITLLVDLTFLRPDLRISPRGAFLGIAGYEEALDKYVTLLRGQGESEEELRELLQVMRTPNARQLSEIHQGAIWWAWVEAWNGLEIGAGTTRDSMVRIPLGGETIEAAVTSRHEGFSRPNLARLSTHSIMEGKNVQDKLLRAIRKLLEGTPNELPANIRVRGMRVEMDASGEFDPRTLRPGRISTDDKVSFRILGEGAERTRTRATYRFTWN